jgi:hypothetical protein
MKQSTRAIKWIGCPVNTHPAAASGPLAVHSVPMLLCYLISSPANHLRSQSPSVVRVRHTHGATRDLAHLRH